MANWLTLQIAAGKRPCAQAKDATEWLGEQESLSFTRGKLTHFGGKIRQQQVYNPFLVQSMAAREHGVCKSVVPRRSDAFLPCQRRTGIRRNRKVVLRAEAPGAGAELSHDEIADAYSGPVEVAVIAKLRAGLSQLL